MVEGDITSFDVPPMLSRCEFDFGFAFDCCNGLLLDQCEVVPIVAFLVRLPRNERSGFDFAEVPVTPKATSSDGFDITAFDHFNFGFRGCEETFDGSSASHVVRVFGLQLIACRCEVES
nr:hypothetical protein [Salinigranum rubrum]